MTKRDIHRGVILSFMWSISHALYEINPHPAVKKIRNSVMYKIGFYSPEDLDIIEYLKVKAYKQLEAEMEGEMDLPIVIDAIYWAYPVYFGKKLLGELEKMVDDLAESSQHFRLSQEVVDGYKRILDKVAFDYLKEAKRGTNLSNIL